MIEPEKIKRWKQRWQAKVNMVGGEDSVDFATAQFGLLLLAELEEVKERLDRMESIYGDDGIHL